MPPHFAFLPVHFTAASRLQTQFRPPSPSEAALDCDYVKMALSGRPRRIFVVVLVVADRDHLVYASDLRLPRRSAETCVVSLSMGEGGRKRPWFEDDSAKPPRLATVGTVRSGVYFGGKRQ
jgi:hypothetical protein